MASTDDSLTLQTTLYVVVVIVAVLVGAVLAPTVWSATVATGPDRPAVAVITLSGGTTDANVDTVTRQLREARNNASIAAVVLRIDSPGGPVDASEEFYLAVNRTARELPVVAYVEGVAASGGYYGIAPADRIYVKPSSTVGSIGVIVQAPLSAVDRQERALRSFIRSGPDKAMFTRDGIRQQLETLQNAFLDTVMRHRGEELTLTRTEVAAGKTYLGPRAVENGFADEIGDLHSAIRYAAGQSDAIEGQEYDVVYKRPSRLDLEIIIAKEDVVAIEDGVVYVNDTGPDEFVRPVRYYAVWGIPTDLLDDQSEVTTNATG